MPTVSLTELDLIDAELLPARLALSTVARPFAGGDPESAISSAPSAIAGGSDGALFSSAVQAVNDTPLLSAAGG